MQFTAHNRGNLQLVIGNNGTFGSLGEPITDPFTEQIIPSCIYPKNSDLVYLYVGAFWIGAVAGRDTVVSTADEDFYENREFWPLPGSPGKFKYGSIDRNSSKYDSGLVAFSEEDIVTEYYDTLTNSALVQLDRYDHKPHQPLGIKVNQRSMAWSYSYAQDFVLFDYTVTNIGDERLRNVFMGIYMDGDAWHVSKNDPSGWNDDMVGFYRTHPAPGGCEYLDTLNIAWHADADGDPSNGFWDDMSVRGVLGAMVVRTPTDELKYSYNWWITNYSDIAADFGPRRAPTPGDPYRYFGPRMGTPEGDRNKYYVLRHDEFDYDLLTVALDHTNEGYLSPPQDAMVYATGWDTRYMLSFGPFNVDPGETLPISFALVAGANLHVNPNDFDDFDPLQPYDYLDKLNFNNLATNARWAGWVYDNPGLDTDGDGYKGEYRVCANDSVISSIDTTFDGTTIISIDTVWNYTSADTTWYRGDGVADFRGAGPPPAPTMKVIPSIGKLTVRWNGYFSENTRDVFSNLVDFEGYRVYVSLDDRPRSFSLLTSYDREDYNLYRFNPDAPPSEAWMLEDPPFTIDSLRILFGDPNFNPNYFTRTRPLIFGGETYYFSPQDANVDGLGGTGEIRKVYPNITQHPGTDPTLWDSSEVTYEHGQPLPKYFEYEYEIKNLLPTISYFVSVTTFDFGSPVGGLPSLETDVLNNNVFEYPNLPVDSVLTNDLDVYIYPNPYLGDADYRRRGYEGVDEFGHRTDSSSLADNRAERIHFANLPPKCTIRIFSLDGDLIREIEHDENPFNPSASHETWDLISRNTQQVVSGLFYWVVESSDRTQMGKLAIIR
ncbi:MAG TPA: hypothetical protein VHP63_01320 [candidate division Zixibacteria bacterium]|nr:hypothetical protein [candidate division Zixibacteria bacterium]